MSKPPPKRAKTPTYYVPANLSYITEPKMLEENNKDPRNLYGPKNI